MAQPGFVQLGDSQIDQRLLVRTEVRQRLNDHWFCTLELRDTLNSPIQAEKLLGESCRISNVDETGQQHVSFSGVFIDVAVRREVWGSYYATLTAASESWLLDQSPRLNYYGSSDVGSVASAVASSAGASVLSELTPKPRPAEYVQWNETDWRFLLRLADDHGGWVRSLNGLLELRNTFDAAIPLQFRGEHGLMEFAVEGQLRSYQFSGANYDRNAALSQTFTNQQKQPGMLDAGSAMASAALGAAQANSMSGSTSRSRSTELCDHQARLQAEAERQQGSAVIATGISREPAVTAGAAIEVSNLGDLSGTWNVTEAIHVWTPAGYENHFRATPWKAWRAPERPQPNRVHGLAIACVTGNYDPEGRGRINVQYTWQSEPNQLAPFASVLAGADLGWLIMPEIGDEVVVSFTDGDPERPVILGCLWNGVHQPPRQDFRGGDAAPNNVKRLVTKSGIRINISDKPGEESISLSTPKSSRLLITEKTDETGRPGIVLHTLGDIFLDAGNRIHSRSALHSRHVDGKIMHAVSVKLFHDWGRHEPYLNEPLHAQLTDGSAPKPVIAGGQTFQAIPQGNCKFSFKNFYDPLVDWDPENNSGG